MVLYELLAGTPPFTGANLARVLVQLVQDDPKPLRQMAPATPEDLETIVAKCLEKDPGRRYGSARELAEDLDRFLDGEPIRARPTGWTYRAGKRLRKNKALAIVSAAAVLALALMGDLQPARQAGSGRSWRSASASGSARSAPAWSTSPPSRCTTSRPTSGSCGRRWTRSAPR